MLNQIASPIFYQNWENIGKDKMKDVETEFIFSKNICSFWI